MKLLLETNVVLDSRRPCAGLWRGRGFASADLLLGVPLRGITVPRAVKMSQGNGNDAPADSSLGPTLDLATGRSEFMLTALVRHLPLQ